MGEYNYNKKKENQINNKYLYIEVEFYTDTVHLMHSTVSKFTLIESVQLNLTNIRCVALESELTLLKVLHYTAHWIMVLRLGRHTPPFVAIPAHPHR